ncbi:MAG: hypothetical protein V4498_00645 [candidate division FCPU426 bacterium]
MPKKKAKKKKRSIPVKPRRARKMYVEPRVVLDDLKPTKKEMRVLRKAVTVVVFAALLGLLMVTQCPKMHTPPVDADPQLHHYQP